MAKVKITGHASGTGVVTVTAPNTSTDRTITLPDATDTLIGTATSDALTTRINGAGGRKNMLYNGAMNVAQRGTSFAAAANGTFSTDRWKFANSSIGVYTVTQDSTGATGFAKSLKIDCTTADASPASADQMYLRQSLEGQDLQHLKKGTASAESVTLSFWVKCNKTGNGQVNLFDKDNSRIIGNTYTISVADTWEQKTITFAGDTTGAFGDDNGNSLQVEWWLDSGSNFNSGTVPTSWEAKADTDRGAGVTLDLADSTSNYLNITGVQLELGSVATDFEHRSYGEELALCQRYYYLHATKEGGAHPIGSAAFQSTNFADFNLHFPTTMRTKPTLEYVSGTDYYTVYANDQLDHFSDFTTRNTSPNAAQIYTNGGMGTGIVAGHAGIGYTRNDNAFMAFSAEL